MIRSIPIILNREASVHLLLFYHRRLALYQRWRTGEPYHKCSLTSFLVRRVFLNRPLPLKHFKTLKNNSCLTTSFFNHVNSTQAFFYFERQSFAGYCWVMVYSVFFVTHAFNYIREVLMKLGLGETKSTVAIGFNLEKIFIMQRFNNARIKT